METPIKILIVEDHELARYGLSLTLEGHPDLVVVSEAENGQEAIERVQSHHPQVVLMDIGMPVMDGITATRAIKKDFPDVKVIMLTSHHAEEEVFAALGAGADAYCMKDVSIDRLCQIIHMVLDGAVWLDPAVAALVLKALPGQQGEVASLASSSSEEKAKRIRYNTDLTQREMEVLKLIVQGKSNKEIAQELEVTTHTAKAHVGNIIQKLSVDDRTQVAVKAIQQGLVEVSSADE